jgi:hypothetical protein
VAEVAIQRIGEFTRRVTEKCTNSNIHERAFLLAEPTRGEYIKTLSEEDVHALLNSSAFEVMHF